MILKTVGIRQTFLSSRNWHIPYGIARSIHSNNNIPLDLDQQDEKYQALNNMYSDMFTDASLIDSSMSRDNEKATKSELEELNEEFESLTSLSSLGPNKLENITKQPGRFIIQSLSNDPYYNLALEDYIFRNTPLDETKKFYSERLLFYINDQCAVIGKNQVIWQELYLKKLEKRGYDILRRLSGGGAVIHDLGNVNYSFLTSRAHFQTTFFNKLIVQWLNSKSPGSNDYQINKRGDILYKGKKCSGSAFKISRGKAYHHGTMLVNSQIGKFSGLLKPKKQDGVKWDSPSVESVRSSITNIGIDDVEEFIQICKEGFSDYFGLGDDTSIPIFYCHHTKSINRDIENTMNKLKSHEWKFDIGPKFKLHLLQSAQENVIEVEHGKITNSFDKAMIGDRFEKYARTLLK
ncbi:putative lipoate-protein ligase A [Monosporozyma unispora]